jgi:hypothetical protein
MKIIDFCSIIIFNYFAIDYILMDEHEQSKMSKSEMFSRVGAKDRAAFAMPTLWKMASNKSSKEHQCY